jgi:hypothetical protein
VILENDSKDGTKRILSSWSANRKQIHLFLDDFNPDTRFDVESQKVNPSFSYSRINKMARYRNRYLDLASRLEPFDYLIVVDLDVYWIDPDGVAHAFGQNIPWDAQFANSRTWQVNLGDFYRDTYAFWEIGDATPQTEAKIAGYSEMLRPLTIGMPLFAVQSAFGGLGIYRWEAVKGLRYGIEYNDDPRVEVICEHAYLHRQMIAAANSRLFINPSMVIHCDRARSRLTLRAQRLVQRPLRWLRRNHS